MNWTQRVTNGHIVGFAFGVIAALIGLWLAWPK